MTPRGRFNLMMGLLVLAAVALGTWRWRQQAHDASAMSSQIAAHAAQTAKGNEEMNRFGGAREERAPPFSAPASTAPMPPWGEPLGPNLDAVRRRADAGDARAACRIGAEASLCNLARAPTAATTPGHDSATGQSRPGNADLSNYCEGIDDDLRGRAAAYLRKAAMAGNTDAMLRYASGPFYPASPQPPDAPGYLHDPAFSDWYADALPMALRALHAGNPLAAQLLASAYADDLGLFDARVADDPVQAYAYNLLLSYLRAGAPPSPGVLDARQRAQAEQQAQKLYRESFGSQPVKGGVPASFILSPAPDSSPRPCE
ncbi:hypothetical protein [Pseudoxanthomonas sp.]|uniref:hypothetical protein n=1 Tax=Pseudoxanthomonas sp. TaxID=1871049 RepID=UPI002614E09B|nr:hypothetical protein [Pseudoxanthomonas sp.]WDS37586.1 MAG: hypothetical protein O8I58_06870 [Pseudoxanthomonas sp.]